MAVSRDAEEALRTIPEPFASQSRWTVGTYAGHALSVARQLVIDRLVDRERSYRGTLFGMHHGVDMITLLSEVAKQCEEPALHDWCEQWLVRRRPLVENAVQQLRWFGQHSELSVESGLKPGPAVS